MSDSRALVQQKRSAMIVRRRAVTHAGQGGVADRNARASRRGAEPVVTQDTERLYPRTVAGADTHRFNVIIAASFLFAFAALIVVIALVAIAVLNQGEALQTIGNHAATAEQAATRAAEAAESVAGMMMERAQTVEDTPPSVLDMLETTLSAFGGGFNALSEGTRTFLVFMAVSVFLTCGAKMIHEGLGYLTAAGCFLVGLSMLGVTA